MMKDELGIIISDYNGPTHLSFRFQIHDEADVRVGQFVEIPIGTRVILGRITLISTSNEFFKNPKLVQEQMTYEIPPSAHFPQNLSRWRIAHVEILTNYEDNKFTVPNDAPEPGEYVYPANEKMLEDYLNFDPTGIYIGRLVANNMKVHLNANRLLSHHIAILGSTGSGKSYTVGIIVEELLDRGIPVVIIDPHGEYHGLAQPSDDPELLNEEGINGRGFPIKKIPIRDDKGKSAFRIPINDISPDAIIELIDATQAQQDVIYTLSNIIYAAKQKALENNSENSALSNINTIQDLELFQDQLIKQENFNKVTIRTLIRKLKTLERFHIFGDKFPVEKYIKKGVATIFDLSEDLPEKVKLALTGYLLDSLFELRKEEKIPPIVIVVEEAHKFAPQDRRVYTKYVLRRLAREGRKFGVSLIFASQRIIGLDKDALSQCGTKFILRITSKTDLDYILPYVDIGVSSEQKRIPHLPNGSAMLTGIAVRSGILMKMRRRYSRHIGESDYFRY